MSEQSIWFDPAAIELNQLNELNKGTAGEQLGIQIIEVGDDFLRGTMPADHRTFQPFGVVHGGCNVVLAETLGSMASLLTIDSSKYLCLGQEVNANHVRAVRSGLVTGTATLAYKGLKSQVWEIRLEDDRGRLSCISRLTMAIVNKPKKITRAVRK